VPDLFWARAGGVLMLVAVAAGAFGAHGLKDKISADLLAVFETGVRYQAYHGLALLAVAWLAQRAPSRHVDGAGWCFLAGTLIFSGSLYALALTGARKLGAVTPIGGVLFLVGWVRFLLAAR
jgi:uncharacterized membrane protein YgdD (TMEM256/DUF423 family)